jgi:four helix bundle protein
MDNRMAQSQKPITSFTDLIAWQATYNLSVRVYETTKKFPKEENFGLTSQMRRSSVSSASNIAEGFGRSQPRDKEHFYQMASGSLYELKSQILISRGLKYINEEDYEGLIELSDRAHKLLNGLLKAHRTSTKLSNVDRLTSNV